MADKKFNVRLTNMTATAKGFMSKVIDDAMYDSLQKIEKGGRLTLILKEGQYGPFGSLELISKEDVDAYAAKKAASDAASNARSGVTSESEAL
jgi:hypothetical protein